MDIQEIAIPAASAAAGSISVVWIAKLLITSWLQKYDSALVELTSLSKDMAVSLHRLTTIEKDLNGLGNAMRCRMAKVEEE